MTQINKDQGTYCSQCNVPLHIDCANKCLDCAKELCDTCYVNGNYLCEACKEPVKSFQTIRRSHIELFNTCPYALYLILEKDMDPPSNDYAKLGTHLHQLMDEMSCDLITLDEALKRGADFVETLEKEKQEIFYNTAISSIRGFQELRPMFDMFKKEFEVEKNIIYPIGEDLPKVSCTIDRIDFNNEDDIHIADWKTGKPMSGQKLITDFQAPLYIKAVHSHYGKYPKTFTFYYLAHGKIKRYELQEGEGVKYEVKSGRNKYILDVEVALEKAKTILTKINNGQFTMPKDVPYYYCKHMCWFFKSGVCASSNKEQWKLLNDRYAK